MNLRKKGVLVFPAIAGIRVVENSFDIMLTFLAPAVSGGQTCGLLIGSYAFRRWLKLGEALPKSHILKGF